MKLLLTFLSLIIVTLTIGCSDFDKFYREKNTRATGLKGGSAVVAKVGDEKITKKDLVRSLENVSPNQRIIYLSSPDKLKEYLDSYINQIVLYKEAQRRGIDNREDIKERVERYKRRLLVQTIGQEAGEQKVSEEDIKDYYNQNLKSLEQIKIRHILITAKGTAKDEARAKAELIAKRAKAGEKFEELVDEFSDDSASKKRGGDVGYISRGRLPVDFENKVFSLKEGEVSDPIETENGFHIIKVTEGARVPPLDQVKGRIEVELRRKSFSDYTKRLRDEMGVEVFEYNLKEISAK